MLSMIPGPTGDRLETLALAVSGTFSVNSGCHGSFFCSMSDGYLHLGVFGCGEFSTSPGL